MDGSDEIADDPDIRLPCGSKEFVINDEGNERILVCVICGSAYLWSEVEEYHSDE